MRLVPLLLAVPMLLAGCAGAPRIDESGASCGDATAFSAPDGAYAFCVPEGWELQTENEYRREWFVFSPSQGPTDGFRENLNLGRVPGKGAPGLDGLAEVQVEALRSAMEDYRDLGVSTTQLGLQPARTVHYQAIVGDVEIEGRQTLAVVNDEVFILTYTAVPGQDPFLAAAQGAQASFRFMA